MQADEITIKTLLENTYDIPFDIVASSESNELEYLISPVNAGQEFFGIKATIRNNIRLIMDFVPEKYSANFIRSLANATESGKRLFMQYSSIIKKDGAKLVVRVNEKDLSLEEFESWPTNWYSLKIRVTKIVNEDAVGVEVLAKWSNLFVGLILSLAQITSLEESETQGYAEGKKEVITANRYERNRMNRALCLLANGNDCKVCGFSFEKMYGPIGQGFIHVHHIVPVSKLGESYIINPVTDLIPVCPNCHAMLHRLDPPLLPDELIYIVNTYADKSNR